ncbi:MAG: DNA polymerase III subunit gamma/tau [bacterium]|nr:DNA polymerase III subunit gamma/tau [bacterium]
MSWYLKYRPKNVSELGLTEVRETLEKLLGLAKWPHAFLLTGPRGLGKTSTARIIAQYVNCLQPKELGMPCGKCRNCQLFEAGQAVDVIEMDAASNRRIDDIRQLRSGVGLAPSQLKYKVYIIDEVHMLTTEAFNALLKTLEEPPEHVMFILATTELHKVPETIKSRCQVIQYRLATDDEMVQTLERVAKGEKLKVDKKDLYLVARRARGSFRDAIKLLEQVSQDGRVESRLVEKLRGYDELVKTMFDNLLDKKFDEVMDDLEILRKTGVSGEEVVFDFQSLLVDRISRLGTVEREELEYYQDLSRELLEISRDVREVASVFLSVKKMIINLYLKYQRTASQPVKEPRRAKVSERVVKPERIKKSQAEDKKAGEKKAAKPPEPLDNVRIDAEKLKQVWPGIITRSAEINHGLQAILRMGQLGGVKHGVVEIKVGYKLHKALLERAKIRNWLEAELARELGLKRVGLVAEVSDEIRQKQQKRKQEKSTEQDDRVAALLG